MEWVSAIGSISGIIALLALAFFAGKYINKIQTLGKTQDKCPIADVALKADALWGMKDNLNATIVKVDTLWKIYVEDSILRHSNPGEPIVLPVELKEEIKKLLDNDNYLSQVKAPTLLVIDRLGLQRFSAVAKENGTSLGQVLAEADSFVFSCLQGKT